MNENQVQANVAQICIAFKEGELDYIGAIEALQKQCGFSAKDAEALVEQWEESGNADSFDPTGPGTRAWEAFDAFVDAGVEANRRKQHAARQRLKYQLDMHGRSYRDWLVAGRAQIAERGGRRYRMKIR